MSLLGWLAFFIALGSTSNVSRTNIGKQADASFCYVLAQPQYAYSINFLGALISAIMSTAVQDSWHNPL